MRTRSMGTGLLAALALAACGSGASPEPSTSEGASTDPVVIQAFEFRPHEISISVGDTVTWVNEDDILHTVTSGAAQEQGVPGVTENTDAEPDGLFDRNLQRVGAIFNFTFGTEGRFDYFCSIHPGMTGVVVVE